MFPLNDFTAFKTLSAEPLPVQISSLRRIKNDIAGHELRKRKYVQEGLIPCVAQVLAQVGNETPTDASQADGLNRLWLQACDVINVIAHGGSPFAQPILHSSIPSTLLVCISSTATPKRALAALRALNAIADNLPVASPAVWDPDRTLANLLYAGSAVQGLAPWVLDGTSNRLANQICDAALALICKTCATASHKQALVDGGILDALCLLLANYFIPQNMSALAGSRCSARDLTGHYPLSPVLETLSLIVGSLKHHASMVIAHSGFQVSFDARETNESDLDPRRDVTQSSPSTSDYFDSMDCLLPHVPDVHNPDDPSYPDFPPLGTSIGLTRRRPSSVRAFSEPRPSPFENENSESSAEFPLVAWLLFLVRQSSGCLRLLASRLLVAFNRFGLITPSRSRSLKFLLAPLLVQMLDDQYQEEDEQSVLLTRLPYIYAVPAVLAHLIENDEELQNVVVQAKAIPKLGLALKANFDHFRDSESSLWKPHKLMVAPVVSATIECTLGAGGPSAHARHTMIHREGLLAALAAIAPYDDDHRKEVCDQGVLSQIMLALEPFESNTQVSKEDGPILRTTGNSASTLLAACSAVRALTRSVTSLRTRLVDVDVSKAIIRLMYNSDSEVRIAATKVISNLVIDFSPMKANINTSDMIKKLCQQVHSANPRLRLESIWALKNLSFNAENKDKREIIDELGPSWIGLLLATDPYDIPPGAVIGLGRDSHDVVMGDSSETVHSSSEDIPRDLDYDEVDYHRHTVEDDFAIQEQLFDLVRNLFCGSNSSDVVDYLINEIGTTEFMRILYERLKPRAPVDGLRKSNSVPSTTRGVLHSVLGLIVHIAASTPKLRLLLTTSTTLMRQIATLCNHTDYRIRVQCCWIVINLIYEDDSSDRHGCHQRALVLRQSGFEQQMKRLQNDSVSDVRERAKTALDMLNKAIN